MLTACITTRRAIKRPVEPQIVKALKRSLPGFEFDEAAVATALHEAIANAAIHGNLGVAARPADGLDSIENLAREIDAGLMDPALAGRPIMIGAANSSASLLITVRDAGSGFVAGLPDAPGAATPHGRGIRLMRAVARGVEYRFGGRQVCLTFELRPKDAAPAEATRLQGQPLDLLSSRILIADDSPTQRDMVRACLRVAGFSELAFAADGNEALTIYYDFQPDLVLLDLEMPGMGGIEVCRILTGRHEDGPPILMLSATLSREERVLAFKAGAADFLQKPTYPPELVARVRTQLERRWLVRNLHSFRERLGQELEAARRMQESLLPSVNELAELRASMGMDIAAHSEMSSELGGDIWGLRKIDEARLGVFIADFTGHGVAAAMNAFRLHALLGESGIRFERPDLVLQAVNVRLAGVLPRGCFATLFYGVIDVRRDVLEYAAGGSPEPVLIDADGTLTVIDTSGVPAGIKHWQEYEVHSVGFPRGASLLLYSDALIETPDDINELWTEDTLLTHLGHAGEGSSAQRLGAVTRAFDAGRPRPLPDDLTLVFLHRLMTAS